MADYWEFLREIGGKSIEELSSERLQEIYKSFVETRAGLGDSSSDARKLDRNLSEGIRRIENELKRRDHTEHHRQAIGLGNKTLFWARVGGIAAAIGTLVLVATDIPFSKLRRAKAWLTSPPSSKQTQVIAEPSPPPKATRSPLDTPMSATPSVEASPK